MGLLDGKVVWISGAGSGMGKASTEVFVRDGARVAETPLVDVTMEGYERITDVNPRGVLLCSKHGIPAMLQSGGARDVGAQLP